MAATFAAGLTIPVAAQAIPAAAFQQTITASDTARASIVPIRPGRAAGTSSPTGRTARAAISNVNHYTITLQLPDSASAQDVAGAVREEIERIERERDAETRASYQDDI